MTTLQNTNNHLSFFIVGCRNLTRSSDVATNKSNYNVNLYSSHKSIDIAVSIISRLYITLLRYVNQYIFHTMVKLFCLIEWRREYNTQLAGEYLRQGFLLVSNHSTNLKINKKR